MNPATLAHLESEARIVKRLAAEARRRKVEQAEAKRQAARDAQAPLLQNPRELFPDQDGRPAYLRPRD